MESKTFTILGSMIAILGIIVLILLLSAGIISEANYATSRVHADYWLWGFVIVPLIFIILGIYYLWLGIKKKKVNKLISASAIIQIIALAIGTIGLVIPMITRGPWDYILTLLLGIPTTILMGIGIILMVIGWIKRS